MLYISLCELMKKWKQTFIITLQIGLIMFLAVISVTTYKEQTIKYDYLREFMKDDGVMAYLEVMSVNVAGGIHNCFADYDAIKEYHYAYYDTVSFTSMEGKTSHIFGYDELFSEYKPELSQGEWYTEVKSKPGVINVVITGNSYGIKVGDTIEVKNGGEYFKIYICGMLKDEASYYSTLAFNIYDSVFDFYKIYDSSREDKDCLMFTSAEQMDKEGFVSVPVGRVLFSFKEGTLKSEQDKVISAMAGDGAIMADLGDVREKTEEETETKMMEIVPIMIGAFLLVSLSIVCFSAIDTLTSVDTYAILYTCGMQWKKVMVIGAVKSVMTCILSTVVMLLLYFMTVLTGLSEDILFELGVTQILVCLILCLFFVLLSCIMPSGILKKYQPVEVLRDSKM